MIIDTCATVVVNVCIHENVFINWSCLNELTVNSYTRHTTTKMWLKHLGHSHGVQKGADGRSQTAKASVPMKTVGVEQRIHFPQASRARNVKRLKVQGFVIANLVFGCKKLTYGTHGNTSVTWPCFLVVNWIDPFFTRGICHETIENDVFFLPSLRMMRCVAGSAKMCIIIFAINRCLVQLGLFKDHQ